MVDSVPIILVSVLLLMVATGIIVLVLVYQKKQLQYLNEKEQLKASFNKEILESRLAIQEQTMKHISQEIHDNIGQVLSVVKLNINMMHCDDPASLLQEKINDTSGLVGKVIRDLRDLSKSLDSDNITEKGLIKAIGSELDLLKKTGAYTTALIIEGEPYDLPGHSELILFRMVQEVINNIIKHAQASSVAVSARFYAANFILRVTDNGLGFDADQLHKNHGSGIKNIKNRSQLIGANYSIDSQPGSGTTVLIELPVSVPVAV